MFGNYMTHAGLSHFEIHLFSTDVMTEGLPTQEPLDVESDVLTISGGCG